MWNSSNTWTKQAASITSGGVMRRSTLSEQPCSLGRIRSISLTTSATDMSLSRWVELDLALTPADASQHCPQGEAHTRGNCWCDVGNNFDWEW